MWSQTEEKHSRPAPYFQDLLWLPARNPIDCFIQPFPHLRGRYRSPCVTAVPTDDIEGRIGGCLILVVDGVPNRCPLANLFFLPPRLLRENLLPSVFSVGDQIPHQPLL